MLDLIVTTLVVAAIAAPVFVVIAVPAAAVALTVLKIRADKGVTIDE